MAMYEYQTLGEAMKAVDTATEETLADNPEFASEEDSIYHDMVQAIVADCELPVAKELCRVTGVAFPSWDLRNG